MMRSRRRGASLIISLLGLKSWMWAEDHPKHGEKSRNALFVRILRVMRWRFLITSTRSTCREPPHVSLQLLLNLGGLSIIGAFYDKITPAMDRSMDMSSKFGTLLGA